MTTQSSRALLGLSTVFLLMGVALSPAPAVLCAALAALLALPPILVGPGQPRRWAFLLFALSVLVAMANFPAAKQHLDRYQEHAVKAQNRHDSNQQEARMNGGVEDFNRSRPASPAGAGDPRVSTP